MHSLHPLWEKTVCKSLCVREQDVGVLENTEYARVGMAALHNSPLTLFLR